MTDKFVMFRDASLGVLLIGALSVVWAFDKSDPSDTRLAQNGSLLQPSASDPKPKKTPRVPADKKTTAKPKKASLSPQDSDDDGSGKTVPKTKVAVKPPKSDVDRDTVVKTPPTPPTPPATKPEPVVVGARTTPKDEPTRKDPPVRDAPKSVPEPKREVVRTILPEPDEKDDAVSRFIAYDIGRLSGIDGQRARTDFNQLGADSIPALIRGLNKSASISASCPVIVILSKLNSQLQAASDEQMYELAITNIGQGVASNAPHAHRLKRFREGLMKYLRDDHPAKRRHQQVTTLMASRDRSAFLQASLSKDPMKRWAVARVAMQRRLPIGDQLIRLLSDSDEAVSHEARLALVSLSRQNYGPAPDATDEERAEAIAKWTKWWSRASHGSVLAKVSRLSNTRLRAALKSENASLRWSAISVVRSRRLPYVTELIDLLSDEDLSVRFEARETLVRLAGGVDHGPSEDATEPERQESLTKWKKWQVLQKMLKANLEKTQTALVAEFKHKDRDKRWAAIAAARKQRMVVIDDFVAVLSDPDDGVRQEARHALVSLSRGTDFGPSENSDNARCEEAVKSWTDWWVNEKEKLAKSKFDQAKKLADAGRREPARRRFQEIIRNFPGTKAARSSKRLMDKL